GSSDSSGSTGRRWTTRCGRTLQPADAQLDHQAVAHPMETPLTHSAETTGAVSVAIISDDQEFGRVLMERWQSERFLPSFTLLGSDFGNGACSAAWDLAVVGCI